MTSDAHSVSYTWRWQDLPTATLVGLAVGPLVTLYGGYLVVVSLGILGSGPGSRDTGLALLVGSLLFVAVAAALSYRRTRPVRRVIGTAVTLTMADDGLHTWNSSGQTSIQPWATLRSVSVRQRHLVLVGAFGRAMWVPKHAFGDGGALLAFRDEVERHMARAHEAPG